jgi:hypothetical protein
MRQLREPPDSRWQDAHTIGPAATAEATVDTDVEATAQFCRLRRTEQQQKMPDDDLVWIVGSVSNTWTENTLHGQFYDPPNWLLAKASICYVIADANGKIVAQEALISFFSPVVDRRGQHSLNCFSSPSIRVGLGETLRWYILEAWGTPLATRPPNG